MKKTILFLAFGLGASLMAFGQKTPPPAVKSAFDQKFHGIKGVHWDQEKNGEWEAEFRLNGTETSANYSATGQWLETETEIAFADLPAAVQTALKGKKVKETAKILRADGSTWYEAEVKHKDLLFDANGVMAQ